VPKKTAQTKKKPKPTKPAGAPRRLQLPERIWYKPLTWRHRKPVPTYKKIPKARVLFMSTLRLLQKDWVLFGGIVLLYGLLNLVLVRGLTGSSDLGSLKSTLDGAFHGLWALRQSTAGNTTGNKVRIRDSFYLGMYPLVPALLIIMLISLQLLPLALGGGLYAAVVSNNITVNWLERLPFLILFIAGGIWTLRMLTASIFAFYIVTLPNMTPLRAYRSARDLVYGRRLYIWRKLVFLPIVLLLGVVLVMFPLILWLTPVAAWAFFALSMLSLPLVHSYVYSLYREML
jgi:hypothetical protein